MKNRLLIPGFSLGKIGQCADEPYPQNISLQWLFYTPGTLLWADEILMSQEDYANVHHDIAFRDEIDRECARLLFDRLLSERVISTFVPAEHSTSAVDEAIKKQVEMDEQRWGVEKACDPRTGKADHCTIRLGDSDYCPVWVRRIYATLFFSRVLNASCLFDSYELALCRKRFLKLSPQTVTLDPALSAFNHVFSAYVPNRPPFGQYVACSLRDECANAETCAKKCLDETSRCVEELVSFRNKEELAQLREVIRDLSQSLHLSRTDLPADTELLAEFRRKVSSCQRLLDIAFPKIERWCKAATMVSIPVALAGTATSNPLITISGAAIAGIAQALSVGTELLSGKYKWVAFLTEVSERLDFPGHGNQ